MRMDNFTITRKSSLNIAIVTTIVLLIPFAAMQVTDAVSWQLGDFLAAGILLVGCGYFYKVLTKNTESTAKKCVIGLLTLAALALIWALLAIDSM